MTAAVIFQGRSSGGSWPLLCDHSQKSAFMGPGRGRFFRFTEFPVLPAMLRKVKTANHQLMLLAKAFLIYLHPQFIHPGNNVATGIVFFSSKFYAQYGAWTHDSWDQKSHAHWLSQLGAYNCIFWWLEQEAKVTGGKRSDFNFLWICSFKVVKEKAWSWLWSHKDLDYTGQGIRFIL